VYRRTRGSPKLSEADKAVRYQWCKKNVTDNSGTYLSLRKANSRPETIPHTVKQRLKVNIWGGISSKGATPFAVSFQNQLTCKLRDFRFILLGI
jgi:hypothetical protein